MNGTDWMQEGRCRSSKRPPDDWFSKDRRTQLVVKAICQHCPVKTECLEFAITNREDFGVWGGLGAEERRQTLARIKINDRPGRLPASAYTC